jgi:elongation factor G
VSQQLREKLNHNSVLMQIPIGLEAELEGVDRPHEDEGRIYFEGRQWRADQGARGYPSNLQVEAEARVSRGPARRW